jgi:dipeptidase
MKMSRWKKLLATAAISAAVAAIMTMGASACTTIYTGANLTEEKTSFVARTEDYGADMNKQWFISESGKYQKDETYTGCPEYGPFSWIFTHDSYRFTYFTNDISDVCPECGGKHPDVPSYSEFGTNEKGVSVSATETISGNASVLKQDPYRDTDWVAENDKPAGIEETDIPTIILAEASTAREGVDLLLGIYDQYGCAGGSGLFICDQNETWYIENCSGTQYVAVKLNDDLLFIEPNMAIIGEVDLDDTDNVIASEKLIQIAKEAGTFVGDEEKNVINFRASYAGGLDRADGRLVQGLSYLNSSYTYDANALVADNSLFTLSNIDAEGKIVPLYSNIKADRTLTKDDIFGFYQLSTVGKPSNQEIEIFQLFPNEENINYATVGWVAVGNMSYNVFVPCYPMLLDSLYEGYQVSTDTVGRTTEKPDGFCTWGTGWVETESGWQRVTGYVTYPENWRDSYYFSFEGLGGYIQYAEKISGTALTDTQKQYVRDQLDALQQKFYTEFAQNGKANPTQNAKDMAKEAHELALELIDYVVDATNCSVTYSADTLPAHMSGMTVPQSATVTGGKFTPEAATYVYTAGDWYYTFGYWTDAKNNKYEAGTEYDIESSLTLTPVWVLYSLNGDTAWNIDDALVLMQYVQDSDHNALTTEQLALVKKVTNQESDFNIDSALTIMQKIQNRELVSVTVPYSSVEGEVSGEN